MEDSDARVDPPAVYLRDGDRLRSPAAGGISAAWIGGLVVATTGGALALAGITLPWATVSSTAGGGLGYFVQLTDLNQVAGPMAALMLILAGAGVAICFASGSRLSSVLRSLTVVIAGAGAVLFFFLTRYLVAGSTVVVRDALTYGPQRVEVESAAPSTGCVLYVVGLLMIALGAGGSGRLPERAGLIARSTPVDEAVRAVRTIAHRSSIAVALIGAVVSAALPWYRVEASPGGMTTLGPFGPDRGDVQAWLVAYRAGLVACLVLTVLMLVVPASARRVRGIGLLVAVAVTVALVMGYVLLWRPQSPFLNRAVSGYATLHPGVGYGIAVLTMMVLAAGFVLLPAGRSTGEPEREPQ